MANSKSGKTGSASGAIFYAWREKDAEVIAGTFLGSKHDVLAQNAALNRARRDISCNMMHLIETYPPGEEVSDEIVIARQEEKMKRLRFEGCLYLLIKHTDKNHLHYHLLINRIRPDGSVVSDANIALRAIAVTKELDREMGMIETPFYFRSQRIRRKEYEMIKRTGEPSNNKILCDMIARAAHESENNFEKFLTNLEREKIGFRLRLKGDKTGIGGISFDCEKTGHRMSKGSDLGTGFGFGALSEFIGYTEEKDFPKLIKKYELIGEESASQKPKNLKQGTGAQKAFYLVRRAEKKSVENEDKDQRLRDRVVPADASKILLGKAIESSHTLHGDNPLIAKQESAVKVAKNDFAATSDSSTRSEISLPGDEKSFDRRARKINSDGDENAADSDPSTKVEMPNREVKLFYKPSGEKHEIDAADAGNNSLEKKTRLIKFLQNKIDRAIESAQSFSGFLEKISESKIFCLPAVDDRDRVIDFVFIREEQVILSDELDENYKFNALVQKLNYPDQPTFVMQQREDPNSFQAQAAILRDKPLSEYWWKMKAETDDKGQVTISPATFEFLRVAYKETFQTDVKNFEDSFTETGTTDKFLQTLDYMQEHVGIYRESVASINKIIVEGRQALGNGTLVLLPNEKSVSRQAINLPENFDSSNENLIEQKQPDETYAEFQAIFKQAGLERIVESKSGAAEFETVGDNATRYGIKFSENEIKFFDVKGEENTIDPFDENRSLTFRRDEDGDFQVAASFLLPEYFYPEQAARFVKNDASEKIGLLKTSEFGKNIIVTRLDIENDSRAEIEEANRANLEKYVSRQLGKELAAEITVRAARYEGIKFQDNISDERLKVTADIGRGEEAREISRADLLREREAIARNNVNNARKQGFLEGMVKDEGISIEAAEKRQYSRAIIKTQAMQKPWIDALDKAIAGKITRLEKATAQADSQLKAEKAKTGSIIKQTGMEDTKQIKPTLSPEKIWLEQIKAVRRFDTDTFVELEEIQQASNLPRPNDVYARLRGMETVAQMNVRREKATLLKRFGKEAAEQNIVVNVRRESGELKLEAWRVEKTQQPPPQPTKEIQEDGTKIKAGQPSPSIIAPRPLTDKLNPASSAKTDLSWISGNQKTLDPYLNPVSVIKNDEGLQIIRAVAGYIDQKGKNRQLAELTEKAVNAAQILKADLTSEAHDNVARLSQAVGTAVQREETMRENLRLDESLNIELLKTPERALKDEEMKQISVIATETGDVGEVKEYYDFVTNDVEFAAAVGETEERLSAEFFLAEARAAGQANNAIERITPLSDGSIDVELNPARLTQAINSFRTAGAFEEFQTPASEKSIIRSLSLEDVYQTGQFLTANNQISEPLNNQIYTIANDLMKTLEPPLNQTEQETARQWAFTQDFYNRLGQMNRSDQFLDEMARQAETNSQNQIPFEQTARNFTMVNPSDRREAEAMKFWENDRRQRETQIARENAQKRLTMTDSEKAEHDALALYEATELETNDEREREGLVQIL